MTQGVLKTHGICLMMYFKNNWNAGPFFLLLFMDILEEKKTYIYFQTYIIFSINLVSFKVTLRSSGTDILYGCHLLLDVCIIYFISCDCIMNNSSLSYPIY